MKNLFLLFGFLLLNLKDSVWTAYSCFGYTACGGTSCSFATLLEQQSKSSRNMSSYFCGSWSESYYCMTLVSKTTSGSYNSTVYSVGVPCISSSLYSSYCNLAPKSVSSNSSGITVTTTNSTICCSTDNCNDQLTKTSYSSYSYITSYASNQIYSSVSIAISLRVNLLFSSDYSDLNSAVSLTFIQNLKNFINSALTNKPSSIVVLSLSNGSVIVNSNLVYSSTTSSSTSLQSSALSSLTSAASASTSSSFPVYSNYIVVTNNAMKSIKSTGWITLFIIGSFILNAS